LISYAVFLEERRIIRFFTQKAMPLTFFSPNASISVKIIEKVEPFLFILPTLLELFSNLEELCQHILCHP
ncbi:hypothetical protein, partial [Idiomarina sp.]|uniref:hypothetical protein n=1 Tax=Idiomarina sp. TaxID=1874361 RepID=UPI002585E01D